MISAVVTASLRRRYSTASASAGAGLNSEWSDLVNKELKGKKSPESLTWQTAEVNLIPIVVSIAWVLTENISFFYIK